MSLKNNLKKLTSLCGISGFEHGVSEYMITKLKSYGFETESDAMGNVIALKKSASGSGKVMLEAHIDEIGFIVKHIDKDGFLRITPIGGIDKRILCASEVVVHGTDDYIGIVGAKPPHLMDKTEYDEVLGFDELYIDVGMSYETASENIPIGSPVTFKKDFVNLLNSHCSSASLDDRAGVAIILECANKLKDVDLGYDLYICGTVQEELGMRGAYTAAYNINPDVAIAIDVTYGSSPGATENAFNIGCGPVVAKGPNIHRDLSNKYIEVLKKNKIQYEIEVEGGSTGTDAWAIQTAKCAIPTMLISVPVKYMHTQVETMSIADCRNTADSICLFLKSFDRMEELLC